VAHVAPTEVGSKKLRRVIRNSLTERKVHVMGMKVLALLVTRAKAGGLDDEPRRASAPQRDQ